MFAATDERSVEVTQSCLKPDRVWIITGFCWEAPCAPPVLQPPTLPTQPSFLPPAPPRIPSPVDFPAAPATDFVLGIPYTVCRETHEEVRKRSIVRSEVECNLVRVSAAAQHMVPVQRTPQNTAAISGFDETNVSITAENCWADARTECSRVAMLRRLCC